MLQMRERPCNGTEGDLMRAQLCDRCAVDHPWHFHLQAENTVPQPDWSCPIIMDIGNC